MFQEALVGSRPRHCPLYIYSQPHLSFSFQASWNGGLSTWPKGWCDTKLL